jgi:ribosomal protein S18 acetylase RimI-like enzyme
MDSYLRLATGNETPVVYRLMEDYYNEVRSPAHPKKHRWAVEKLIDNPAVGKLWLVMVGNDVVGYLILTLGYALQTGGVDAFIDDLYIVPQARSHGLGRTAIQMALAEAAQLGVQSVHLEVEPSNEKGRNLCRFLGFQERERPNQMTYGLSNSEGI